MNHGIKDLVFHRRPQEAGICLFFLFSSNAADCLFYWIFSSFVTKCNLIRRFSPYCSLVERHVFWRSWRSVWSDVDPQIIQQSSFGWSSSQRTDKQLNRAGQRRATVGQMERRRGGHLEGPDPVNPPQSVHLHSVAAFQEITQN